MLKYALITQNMYNVSNHVLVMSKLLLFNKPWQGALHIFQINKFEFNLNFGNVFDSLVMLVCKNIAKIIAYSPEEFLKFVNYLGPRMFPNLS